MSSIQVDYPALLLPSFLKPCGILYKVSQKKFPYIMMVEYQSEKFALKVFSHDDNNEYCHGQNEWRFGQLSHPYILPIKYVGKYKEMRNFPYWYSLSPYCKNSSLYDFLFTHELIFSKKVIRSYFTQIVKGVKYLHSQGCAHLDLKLENILIGDDSLVKIIDFERSYVKGDSKILSQGTPHYRPPEVQLQNFKRPFKVDSYSLGIIYFILIEKEFPFLEGEGDKCRKLIERNPAEFWKWWEEKNEKNRTMSEIEADLFYKLIRTSPRKRLTMKKVLKHKALKQEIFSDLELRNLIMPGVFT